jgi:hypothetical protein
MTEHAPEAPPMVVQWDVGLMRCAPLPLQQRPPIERRSPFQHGVHGPSQLMGAYGEGLALAVCFLQAGEIFLARIVAPEEHDGRCGEGPRQGGVPALRARGAIPLAC